MSAHPWPATPVVVDCFTGRQYGSYCWHYSVVPDATCCKHGGGSCETCGTTNRRDHKHKTNGGKGLVARIPHRNT